jgi:CHAT domain-containing protein
VSCTHKMSLKEAKQVTVSMSGVSAFVPPPRRIDDIVTILDQPGEFDPKITRKLKAQYGAVPPEDADSRFYEERGEASHQLGLDKQALDDLREALSLSYRDGTPGKSRAQILRQLATVERSVGDFDRAVELLEEALGIADDPKTFGKLVEMYIQIGDMEKARERAREGESFCAQTVRQGHQRGKHNGRFILWCSIETAAMKAALLEAQANYGKAEEYIRQRLKLVQAIEDEKPEMSVEVRFGLANNLMKQERFIEAEIEARQALKESLGLARKDSLLTMRAAGEMADILRAQGRLSEAEKLSLLSVHALEASGIPSDSYMMATAQMKLGSIFASRGDFTDAMNQFDLAMKGMEKNQYLSNKDFRGNPDFILSLLMIGRSEEASTILAGSYTEAVQRFGEKHYITAELLAFRGMANFRSKNLGQAVQDFALATDTLLAYPIDKADYSRTQRLRIILDDYINLLIELHGASLEKELGVDAVGTAFRMAEASRGRTVQRALAASSARAAETNPALNDLMRREQDARKQVEVMESTLQDLMAAPTQEQKPATIRALQTGIVNLNRASAALQDEIKKHFPKYADFVNPQAATMSLARQDLRPGEALISIYTSDNKTYIWAIPYRGEVQFATSPLGNRELSLIVANLRKSLDAHPTTFGDIPSFDLAQAYLVYSNLLKPVEAGWKDASDLLIVDSGSLSQLPFALLPTSQYNLGSDKDELFSGYRAVPWLIRKASITMLPSVNSLIALRALPGGDPRRKAFAGFGDPIFNLKQLSQETEEKEKNSLPELASRGLSLHVRGVRSSENGNLDSSQIESSELEQLDRLPDTAEEITSIAQALGADLKQDVFLGKDVSKRRITTMNLADRKVIAFATHALAPGDLDGLNQPALALSSPAVTGDNEDGLLTMGEILKLKLNADWVVLSACNTGAAEGEGAEAVSGLGRAFFYAGTRSLLVSMWPVETTSARELVTEIFHLQQADRNLTRAKSLRKSMLAIIDEANLEDDATGRVIASYAHPFFWAPFEIVGDSGSLVQSQ